MQTTLENNIKEQSQKAIDQKAKSAQEMNTGATKTVKIERMSYGPDGIAHLESGKTVFVAGGAIGVAPGDVCEISIDSVHKRFDRAHIVKLIEPSPVRTAISPTAISPWASMDYEEQLRQKKAAVENAMIRTAGLSQSMVDLALKDIAASPDQWGYRNKIELNPTSDDRGKLALGIVEADSDEEEGQKVVPLKDCPLANNLIEQAPFALSGACRFIKSRARDLSLDRVGIRASTRTNKIEVAIWTQPGPFPRNLAAKVIEDATHATSIVRVISDGTSARKIKKVEVLAGDGYWRERLAGCAFKVSAPSFFQVNTSGAETLVNLALDAIAEFAADADKAHIHIADVYSGVGTFSIPLAKRLPEADISAVELAGSSARDFERNCRSAEVDIDFICDDAARGLPQLGNIDAIIVDPPRAGLSNEALDAVLHAGPSLIVYVSCDPQTLARDTKKLVASSYGVRSITPVDMFPQTYHVETVSIFTRSDQL